MKMNASATRTLAAALLLFVSAAFDAPAQTRPAPPTPSTNMKKPAGHFHVLYRIALLYFCPCTFPDTLW